MTTGSGAEARVTRYEYDPTTGFLVREIDPLGRTTEYQHDGVGRVIAVTRPDGRQVSLSYDRNSNVTSLTPAEKPVHSFTYDSASRPIRYGPPGVAGVQYPNTATSYNEDGQVVSSTDVVK